MEEETTEELGYGRQIAHLCGFTLVTWLGKYLGSVTHHGGRKMHYMVWRWFWILCDEGFSRNGLWIMLLDNCYRNQRFLAQIKHWMERD